MKRTVLENSRILGPSLSPFLPPCFEHLLRELYCVLGTGDAQTRDGPSLLRAPWERLQS